MSAFTLTLDDDSKVSMIALNQSRTYEGLLEGLPTTEMNVRTIARAIVSAQKIWGDAPQLIPPKVTPISVSRKYPFGDPASIPGILCLSRWESGFESRGDLDGSAMCTIVWFQSEFALPIDEAVAVQIRSLNWNSVSTFHQW